ncbi:MAG: TatD family hydrolase [Patescibacteria group bacterium]|nr:TatD family hydrolase [Patescibacteria group bacterium]MDD4304082.1 TatD family hydrolase [Patescibacteria group bacterium]MDD4694959.1 TatD family hydrolase [Patescibacteria group bacterium]
MLIDTHAHLNFEAYNKDREDVIKRCLDYSMAVINVGAQFETSKKAVEISKYDNFYNTIGLHPIHVFDEKFDIKVYQKLITNRTVGIGETGFDYFHSDSSGENNIPVTQKIIDKQREVFIKHIQLAKENDLPLICHGRNSKNDFKLQTVYFDILKTLENQNYTRGVVHCFGGSLTEALSIVDSGMYIGFTGIITFPNADKLRVIAKEIPLDKILIETDSPYLAPQKYRGERNEPIYVEEVASVISDLKGVSMEDVIESTWQNAKILFNLK